jgi:hypothetical protein
MQPIIVSLVAVAAIALVILALVKRAPVHSVAETGGRSVAFSPELQAFLAAYTTAPDKAHPSYAGALVNLKEHAKAVIEEVEKLDRSVPQDDYATRQALVFAVSEASDPAGITFLRRVALHELPRSATHDLAGPLIQETGLSLTAIDGLEWLAAAGHADAAAALIEAVRVPSLTVRAVALTALRESGRTQMEFETAVASLPPEFRHLGNVRRTKVEDAGQVADPRTHLCRIEKRTHRRPPIGAARVGFASPAYREGRGPAPRAGGGRTHG